MIRESHFFCVDILCHQRDEIRIQIIRSRRLHRAIAHQNRAQHFLPYRSERTVRAFVIMGAGQSSSSTSYGKESSNPSVVADDATTTASGSHHLSETKPKDDGPSAQTDADSILTTTKVEFYDANRPKGGMPLVHYVCRKKKSKYEKCVKTWYSKEFMTGAGSLNQEEVCGESFEAYKGCILKGIRKEVWDKQGLPPPAEGSPLADLDHGEEK
jgi:hypothetical protein